MTSTSPRCADPQSTTAVYMPLGTLRDLATRLLAAGHRSPSGR